MAPQHPAARPAAVARPAQRRGVVGDRHELGHLRGAHGRFGAWIYRQRCTWARLGQAVQAEGRRDWVFGPFLRWFAPYFNAYTFVLARLHEYQADAAAARVASAQTAGSALCRI
ncbi:MAG: M48 family metalloprotease, partial [Planctomycetes bacterium]|nr:M48 family metalloprotease [Planctomycetota bacterium]